MEETYKPTTERKHRGDSSVSDLDAEKVLTALGKYGKYQMMSYFLLNIVSILYSAQTLIMGFIAVAPEFECKIKQPESGPQWEFTVIDQCSVADPNNWTIACNNIPNSSFAYNESARYSTINSEFDLVCRDEHWAQHASSIFMLGGMIATPLLTQLSDLHGRRFTFLVPLWVAVVSSLACAVAPTYGIFLFFRLIAGMATTGFSTIGWVLCCESVAVEFRSLIPFVGTFTWVLGIIMVGVLRLWIQNWRWLYFAITVPGILTFSYYWLLPESLHWMVTHKKHNSIRRYIQRSSRYNNIEISLLDCKTGTNGESGEAKKRTIVDIVKNKILFFHLVMHCFITITLNASYWGLALCSTQLSEDGYTGFFLSALVEVPAGILAVIVLVKFGRRSVTFWSLFLQGVSMGLAILYPGPGKFEMIFPIAAKIFNSIAWSSQPLLLAEMSPTSIRNIFYGLVTFFGEIGAVIAPYLSLLAFIDKRAPQTAVALLSVIAAVIALTSPETKDKPMPEDLNQFDPGCLFKRRSKQPKCKAKDCPENGLQQPNREAKKLLTPIQEESESAATSPVEEKPPEYIAADEDSVQ